MSQLFILLLEEVVFIYLECYSGRIWSLQNFFRVFTVIYYFVGVDETVFNLHEERITIEIFECKFEISLTVPKIICKTTWNVPVLQCSGLADKMHSSIDHFCESAAASNHNWHRG